MTKTQAYLFDGVKSSLLWDEETTAWSYLSGKPEQGGGSLYRTIPTLYRGVNIVADAMTKVPFSVMRGKNEFDVSEEWANKVEFLPNPRRTFLLLSQSLDRNGVAYLLKVKNRGRVVKELKWLAASSIEPVLDDVQGLVGFKRTIGSRTIDLPVEDVVYFWLPDSDVELGPPMSYPLKAAASAAGVLANLSAYMGQYFERGAIRPLIVTAKNMPNKDERERMETWLNRLLGGIKNAFRWKIFNADALDFKQIGDGLDQLQNQTLTADQRQDVSLALGIPQTILFANSANFATSMSDQRNFYDMTVVPRAEFIASVINEQILEPAGLRLEFRPDEMDLYQEDEKERAGSLAQLTGAGVPLLMALDLLGYDLTPEQRAELEALEAEPEPEPIPPQLMQSSETPLITDDMIGDAEAGEPAMRKWWVMQNRKYGIPIPPHAIDDPPAKDEPNGDAMAEEKRWKRACLQAFRKGHTLPVDWIADNIPASRAQAIKQALTGATDAETISAAFQNSATEFYSETPAPQFEQGAVTLLAAELKRANDLLVELRE